MIVGPRNSIADIAGVTIGNAEDRLVRTGVTAIVFDPAATASIQVSGGAPGTRDTELLAPENMVSAIHGLFLAGGSVFGLDAGGGMLPVLRARSQGLDVHGQIVPIVPGAILFDLANGGNKDWGGTAPYRELGYQAASSAGIDFATGSAGAGFGALVAGLKGGLGTASAQTGRGISIGALVAVNSVGAVTVGETGSFWAAPFERNKEFGGLGFPDPVPADATDIRLKFRERPATMANTTIGVIATDAILDKAQAKRLAIAAHDGLARAIWPAHTPLDGDLVFGVATGGSAIVPQLDDMLDMLAAATAVFARAIARAIYDAKPLEGDLFPAWREKYGDAVGQGGRSA